jgi:predicted naringenin-chalcone synthase
LNGKPYSVLDLLQEHATDPLPHSSTDAQDTADPLPFKNTGRSQLKIVWRERSTEPVKKRVFMSETDTYPEDITVNEENGYYIVQPTESVVFLSKGALFPTKLN